MELKPIPAFYCCYLLRSTVRHASVYVGSSPDPARRLAQHNGRVQGGAVRTSRDSLRPWEVTCVVAGFPSNIAALQFEWAWQNSHLTRHIPPHERISFAATRTKTSRTGKVTRRPGRPRTSLMDKLSNLHLLLRASYFSRWPLEVRFFSPDAYQSWQTWCGRVDTHISQNIKVHLDPPQMQPPPEQDEFTSAQPVQRKRKADLIGKGGVDGVDPTYAAFREVFDKSQFLLDEEDNQTCSVCKNGIDVQKALFVVCPTENCQSISHVTCLADASLGQQQSASLVPQSGHCSSCGQQHPWSELMQQVTLRTRGMKEVKKIMARKGRNVAISASEVLEEQSEEESEAEAEGLTAEEVIDEEFFDEQEDDDNISIASTDSQMIITATLKADDKIAADKARLEIVIEDSEEET
ncbi:hypothetical protein PV08_02492 [Exophiala spinifera]|uniref:GIY-YIG domain-containing protein n=1 Tax=Exophiala spinifera TaxID=91928 RepID=A0A0D2C3J1_9EURO|nr:uncharacterized protein PV08_02492 [Exophiala spinifera]KIW18204.1 hypothetical protein PV08_02492 [Exophiala spinifera]